MPKAKVKEVEIAYILRGTGEPLVLIGGFTMTKETWGPIVSALVSRFQVLTFDNRGVGETTFPAEPFTIADMAADVVGLLDALGIPKAHFFGVSMGGLITQMILLDHAERVLKAALGCTSHGGRHAVQPSPDIMNALASFADPAVPPIEKLRKAIPVLYSDRFVQEHPDKIEEFTRVGARYVPTPEGAAAQFRALSVFNVKKRLSEVRRPVLVITGDQDRMMPPENSKLLAEAIPKAQLCIIPETGHSFFHEKPREVAERLITFFSGNLDAG